MPRTHVDRGGTFTDVVVIDDAGAVRVRKVPSDQAVIGELTEGELTFGTTVATNALLERKGERTLLMVSRGFGDLPWIRDQRRPALFDLEATWPEPLCCDVLEVGGRLDSDGREVAPLEIPENLPRYLKQLDISSVAVVLMNSHRNPVHERALATSIPADIHVSMGHLASPELGYLSRIDTTLVDAAITPPLRRSLIRDRIPESAMGMRSDGGLCPAEDLRAPDAVLSGPAGGVLAVAHVAAQAGFERAVGLDMGGTSTDICRLDVGSIPRRDGDVLVAGVYLRRAMLEVETIAAGGGSILGHDGRRLHVGPESAGADPGPQCYGRGGPPTLTDAALAAGLIDPLAFDPPLRKDLVSLPGEPEAYLGLAEETMAQAVKRLGTSRGVDLRDHALVSYGGAAGQYAARVAQRLGISTVLVHPCAAVLSAWGQSLARPEATGVAPLWIPLVESRDALLDALGRLENGLPDLGETVRTVEVRHQGTDHPIEVPVGDGAEEELSRAFQAAHRVRYGFDRPELALEIVNARVRVRAHAPVPPSADEDPWSLGDMRVTGPQRICSPTTAVWVPEGWSAQRRQGLLWLQRDETATDQERIGQTRERSPFTVELWSRRFQGVAEEAGTLLQRFSRSVNIRERLDFSCAIFDGEGQLVANAPHIPVHLGAMGETVRDLIARHPEPEPGQAWLSNDPNAGGSHLPDLTVVTTVLSGGHRWFVASRAHHVDVGGLTPGSMPPHSRRLSEEGIVLRHLPLLVDGALRDLSADLAGCREPETVRADLEAQIASNAHGARQLKALGPPEVITAWMAHLQDVADEAVGEVISGLSEGIATDEMRGVPLRMRLQPEEGRLTVDLSGTGGPHEGNLNAPTAVVRAAVLFSLRVLVGRPIPLNEGALRRVDIQTPSPSVVAPPPDAAVCGGNVETSQRLVDLFLTAAGHRAASQGTMNNLTLGGDRESDGKRRTTWSLYETVGGGQGASVHGPGADSRQVHMTNTRATDAEVLEARLPLRLITFARREDSGGDGAHRGGDGIVREIEVLAPATVALLATARTRGRPGLSGGQAGEPGGDSVRESGQWRSWDGNPCSLKTGDRVRIKTPGGGGYGQP